MASEQAMAKPAVTFVSDRPEGMYDESGVPLQSERRTRRARSMSEGEMTDATALARVPQFNPFDGLVRHEQLAAVRDGDVLSRNMALKEDHYPTTVRSDMPIRISGAPNFRRTDNTRIFGVGQPTLSGIRGILNFLGAGRRQGQRAVLWVNLRGEPTVYIAGKPYVLRDVNNPLRNIGDYAGIDRDGIEQLEWKLKEDIIREADRCNGNIAVLDELSKREVDHKWEPVPETEIHTPLEVARLMRMQGYHMTYRRLCCAPDAAITVAHLEALSAMLLRLHPNTSIVFNCQMGRARTTTAMVVASLVMHSRGLVPPPPASLERLASGNADESEEAHSQRDHGQYWSTLLKQGEYRPVRRLLQWLPVDGAETKQLVDRLMSANSHTTHLLQLIFIQRARAERAGSGAEGELHLRRACVALQRYLRLLVFAKYLRDTGAGAPARTLSGAVSKDVPPVVAPAIGADPSASPASFTTFSAWLRAVPDLNGLVSSLPGSPASVLDLGADGAAGTLGRGEDAEQVARRRGRVLCANMILLHDGVPQRASAYPRGPTTGASLARHGSAAAAGRAAAEAAAAGDSGSGGSGGDGGGGMVRYRRVARGRVHALCTPTRGGAASVLDRIAAAHASERRKERTAQRSAEQARADSSGDLAAAAGKDEAAAAKEKGEGEGEEDGRAMVLWVNLRETPMLYVKGQPVGLRDAVFAYRHVKEYQHVTGPRLEMVERQLKEETVAELRKGRLLLHRQGNDGALHGYRKHYATEDIQTPRETLEGAAAAAGVDMRYVRLPIGRGHDFSPRLLDALLLLFRRTPAHKAHVVFNDGVGAGRSTMCTIAAALWFRHVGVASGLERMAMSVPRHARQGPAEAEDDDGEAAEDASSSLEDDPCDFQVVLSLLRVVRSGVLSRQAVDTAVDACSAGMHLRKYMASLQREMSASRTSDGVRLAQRRVGIAVRRYFHLIAFQCFISRAEPRYAGRVSSGWMRPDGYQSLLARHIAMSGGGGVSALSPTPLETASGQLPGGRLDESKAMAASFAALAATGGAAWAEEAAAFASPSFAQWFSERRELGALLVDLEERPQKALQRAPAPRDDATWWVHFMHARRGDVLGKDAMVKFDHFPGCEKDLGDSVEGAPNFRSVVVEGRLDGSRFLLPLFVHGLAMPTVDGISEVVARIQDSSRRFRSETLPVTWINLREEPICFVNGRPFVVRQKETPFKNFELTGISRQRLEGMEKRLVADLAKEADAGDGRVLLHDEKDGKVTGHEEGVTDGSILTLTAAYGDLTKSGLDMTYKRIPVTDERAPKPEDVDEIAAIVLSSPQSHLVLNCQMGRGRTTTGMVLSTLLRLWQQRQWPTVLRVLRANRSASTPVSTPVAGMDHDMLRSGHWRVVRSLMRVVEPNAKEWADAAIDLCSAMQNLREAVLTLKLTADDTTLREPARHAAMEAGVHYLKRYVVLICFAAFLCEQDPSVPLPSFKPWFLGRAELQSLIAKAKLE